MHFPVQTRSEKEDLGGLEAWPLAGACMSSLTTKQYLLLDFCEETSWILKGKVYHGGGVQQGGNRYRFPL